MYFKYAVRASSIERCEAVQFCVLVGVARLPNLTYDNYTSIDPKQFRGAAKRRTRGGQGPATRGGQGPVREPSHRVDRAQGRCQEEDKAQPESPATEPSHEAQPQSSGARPVSVASSFLAKIEPQQ